MSAKFSVKFFSSLLISALFLPSLGHAETPSSSLVVNVYANSGLVHDAREILFKKGINEVAFEGVSSSMQPETALFSAQDINVLEQNYDYKLLNADNLMNAFIGQKVKTVWQNPENGQEVFNQATLLGNVYGKPILQFDYGIETDFPGRLVYSHLPSGLREKPTLLARVESQTAGKRPLTLTYLTTGLSWRADYMAEMISEDKLNLKTWVYLKNDTGADFENAVFNLVSGSVNFSYANGVARPMMLNRAAKAETMLMTDAAVAPVVQENLADYHVYHLPYKTSLKDKQAKQLSLMNFDDVAYEKEYVFSSPLYFNFNAKNVEFKSLRPNIVVKMKNEKEAHLGKPLPAGKVRFYEKDQTQNLLFVGEDDMSQKAQGDVLELTLGKAFDVYANGKIIKAKQLAKEVFEYDVAVDIYNTAAQDKQIVFKQALYNDFDIVSENLKSRKENSTLSVWRLNLPKKTHQQLLFTIRTGK